MTVTTITFAGAGPVSIGSPWGTLGLIVQRALRGRDYDVIIEPASWGANNPRYVADGRAVLGATQYRAVREAYRGERAYDSESQRGNLRLIATINQPAWIGVALKAGTPITDLSQVRDLDSFRLKTSGDRAFDLLFEYYGFSRDFITPVRLDSTSTNPAERWAGRDENRIASWVMNGEFDAIIDPIYAAYTPEHRHWWDATILHELRFLPLPPDLIDLLCREGEVDGPGFIPHRLMRWVDEDIPSVRRLPQVIYTREDVSEDFVYELTAALDENRHLFRETHLPYSYDPVTVAQMREVPFHTGALKYYREVGYVTT